MKGGRDCTLKKPAQAGETDISVGSVERVVALAAADYKWTRDRFGHERLVALAAAALRQCVHIIKYTAKRPNRKNVTTAPCEHHIH